MMCSVLGFSMNQKMPSFRVAFVPFVAWLNIIHLSTISEGRVERMLQSYDPYSFYRSPFNVPFDLQTNNLPPMSNLPILFRGQDESKCNSITNLTLVLYS